MANFIEPPALLMAALNASGGNMVATVFEIKGQAWANLPGNSKEKLDLGSSIEEGSEILTGKNSKVTLLLEDGSTLSLGSETRINIDELHFDATSSVGSMLFSVLKGVFSFASGLIARDEPQNVVLRTPTAEIGLRGTKMVGEVLDDGTSKIGLVDGRIVVKTEAGEVVLDKPFLQTTVSDLASPPREASAFDFSSFVELKQLFDNAQDLREFQSAPDATRPNPALAEDLPDEAPSIAEDQLIALPENSAGEIFVAAVEPAKNTIESISKAIAEISDKYNLNLGKEGGDTTDHENLAKEIKTFVKPLFSGENILSDEFIADIKSYIDEAIKVIKNPVSGIPSSAVVFLEAFLEKIEAKSVSDLREFLEESSDSISSLLNPQYSNFASTELGSYINTVYEALNLELPPIPSSLSPNDVNAGYTLVESIAAADSALEAHQS